MDKLPLVQRPAIFHSNDHFILIEDGQAIPQDNYTGWVLTPQPIGQPLPYSLAKQINGKKSGRGIASTILPFIGSVVGNLIVPGAGGIFGGVLGGAAGGALQATGGANKGQWWRIPLGAIGGGAMGGLGGRFSPLLAGAAGLAAELPSAIKNKSYGAPILAGLGGYFGAKGLQSFNSGANLNTSAGIGGRLSSGLSSVTGGLLGKSSNAAGGGGVEPLGGFSSIRSLTGQSTPSLSQQLGAFGGGTSSFQSPNIGNIGSAVLASGTKNLSQSIPSSLGQSSVQNSMTQQPAKGSGLESIFGKISPDVLKIGAAGALSQLGKPQEYNPDSLAAFDKSSKYLNGTTLPTATNEQLNRYLTMSIPDLKNELLNPNAGNRSLLEIDKKYEEALAQVQRIAANSGQSIETSSDARKQYDEINRQWAEARANLQNELDQQATTQAIGIHQWALEQSIKQGQFDFTSAMELAAMIGRDEELKAAVEQDNYDDFQRIIQEIFSIGSASKEQGGITINLGNNEQQSNLSSVLGR